MAFYHLYNRGVAKQLIFRSWFDRKQFLRKFEEYSKSLGIQTLAYCLMPNHFHFLLGCLTGEPNLEGLMRKFCTSYAMYFNRKYNRVGHLFQNRYRTKNVSNNFHLLCLSRYIHQNPLKLISKNASAAEKWRFLIKYRWSSYPSYYKCSRIEKSLSGSEILKNAVFDETFDDNNIRLNTGVLVRLFGKQQQLERLVAYTQGEILDCELDAINEAVFDKNLIC